MPDVTYCDDPYKALEGVDAMVLLTGVERLSRHGS